MSHNLFFDLPFCLQQLIYTDWLGGITGSVAINERSLMALDSALCNSQIRPSLYAIYQSIDFEQFFYLPVLSCDYRVTPKICWALARPIGLSKLAVNCARTESELIFQLIQTYGAQLEALELMNYTGQTSKIAKLIATVCGKLEKLELERFGLTVPITKLLNKSTSMREVRLEGARSPARYTTAKVAKKFFERIRCPSVVKLAVGDRMKADDVSSITKAFPNVIDLELTTPDGDVIAAMCAAWSELEVLRIVVRDEVEITDATLLPIAKHCSKLRKIVLHTSQYDFPTDAFVRVLTECNNLNAVCLKICGDDRSARDAVVATATVLRDRLHELQIGDMWARADLVQALADNCPNLAILNMDELGRYAESVQVLQKCPLRKLRIGLSKAGNNRLPFLAQVAEHCQHLQVLSLHEVHFNFPQRAVFNIVAKCQALNVLDAPEVDLSQWRRIVRPGVRLKDCREETVEHNLLFRGYDL